MLPRPLLLDTGSRAPALLGITVSYWESLEAIAAWRAHPEHRVAQERSRSEWYSDFHVRVCRVERESRRAG